MSHRRSPVLVHALFAVAILFGAPCVAIRAQVEAPASAPTAEKIEKLRVRVTHDLAGVTRSENTSIMILDAETGQTLFERSPNEALVPASNTKLFTGAAALALLGPDFTFETRFGGTAPLKDGVLDGDLIIQGEGDPTVNERFVGQKPMLAMLALAQRLADAGLKKVNGRILGDVSAFVGPATGENWPQEPYWKHWMVELSPLVFNDNQTTIVCTAKEARAEPNVGFVHVVSHLVPCADQRSEAITVSRSDDGRTFTVSGRVWERSAGTEINVNVGDGSVYFLTALAAALREKGIEVKDGVATTNVPKAIAPENMILSYKSKLTDTLAVMLQESNNLYAELIFRAIGARFGGEGSFRGGWRALYSWLGREAIYEKGTTLSDGSGLSRANRASAAQLARLLQWVWKKKELRDPFRSSLAQPGQAGTLQRRLLDLKGKLFAKTGTLSGVSTLSGYVQSKSGRWLIFALLFNEHRGQARGVQDRICTTLAQIDI